MSTSRAEGSRLAPLNAINQHFRFGFGQFPDFHGFSKAPPLSKIRKFQEIDEIKRRNGIFVEIMNSLKVTKKLSLEGCG